MEDAIHFDNEAAKAGFLAASPNGCSGLWSYTRGGSKVADEDFIGQMIHRLEGEFTIDKARVFVVAASAGSPVAYRLACDFSNEIAAIASVAGTMRLADVCQPARPVSILAMHGTADDSVPFDGGGQVSAINAVIQRWTQLDGCADNPTLTQTGITVTSIWKQCQSGAVVRLDKVVGGHHTWFGSSVDPVPGEPDANTTSWSFFSSLPART
jgi:polyhydroxybutyrate depolymerase